MSSRLFVGLKSQYPGPTHVAMVRGLKYEYSLGLSDSCRHMVVMSPSPIGMIPLHGTRHAHFSAHLHCSVLRFRLFISTIKYFFASLSPSFLGAPPRAGVFVLVKGIPAVSRSSVIVSVPVETVTEIRRLVRLDVSVYVERMLALLHLLQQLVQVGRLCRRTEKVHPSPAGVTLRLPHLFFFLTRHFNNMLGPHDGWNFPLICLCTCSGVHWVKENSSRDGQMGIFSSRVFKLTAGTKTTIPQ